METIRFKDGRYIKSVVLTKQLILSNTEAPSHFDYGNTDYIVAEVGKEVNVLVKSYPDGRVYYTAFLKENGVYYAYTKMKDKNGKIIENCGGMRASYELKKILG